MKKIQYAAINHAAFATNNIKKTKEFWADILGFKMVLTMGKKGDKQYFFAAHKNLLIGFFEWPEVESPTKKRHGEKVKGPFLFDHIAIEVKSLQDLSELQDRLMNHDLPVSDIIDHGFLFSIYTYDPNAIALEFNCLKKEIDIFENPQIKDLEDELRDSPELIKEQEKTTTEFEKEQLFIIPGEGSDLFD